MDRRAAFRRTAIAAGFAIPLGVLALWARTIIVSAHNVPTYVARLVLPDGSALIGLPRIEGPADAGRPLVVIDAGHGGHDPGASGAGGAQEKRLTLALARAVRDALVADGRVRVALTRDADRFLVLEERAEIARRLGANLFISIHADAADNNEAGGATIYTLSDRGSDAVADRVAARENKVDTINGVSLGGRTDAVSSILVDLSQREMRTRSQAISDLILRESRGNIPLHADPQRQAAFVVLKSLDVPSILLEAGYISNADDARAMLDTGWRAQFGRTLAQAIEIALARQEASTATP
jgi:N-acetylmuramoyl-L-alanine amidase